MPQPQCPSRNVASKQQVTLQQMAIGIIASGIDASVSHCALDGAVILAEVQTVGVTASADMRSQIWHQRRDLFGRDIPKLKLAYARSVEHPSCIDSFEWDQCRSGGRVASFLIVLADRGDRQP